MEPRSEKGEGNVPGEGRRGKAEGVGCWGEGKPYCILDAGTMKFKDDLSQRLPSGASIGEIHLFPLRVVQGEV